MSEQSGDGKLARARRAWLIVSLFPIAVCVWFAFACAYDAPYWDEWAYVQPIAKTFDGTFRASDFLVRVNEHVFIVSSAIVIPLARLTHWDIRFEIAAIVALMLGAFAALVSAARRVDASRAGSNWVIAALAASVFSGSQYGLWNFGLHVSLAAALAFTVLAITVLAFGAPGPRTMVVAVVCAWMATYSIGGGLSVWPAGFAVVLTRYGLRRRGDLAAWVLLGICAVGLYALVSSRTSGLSASGASVIGCIEYVLAFLGGPVAVESPAVAVLAGVGLLVVASIWLVLNGGRARAAVVSPVVAGLLAAALSAGVLTATKHAHEGAANAISSRFLPWGTLGWCGVMIAVYGRFPTLRMAPVGVRVAVGLLVTGVLASSAIGFYRADERHDVFVLGRRALLEDPQSPDLAYLHPRPEEIRPLREVLIAHGLTVFRGR